MKKAGSRPFSATPGADDDSLIMEVPAEEKKDRVARGSILGVENVEEERPRDYKGRYRVWPGALLLLVIIATSAALITIFAIQTSDDVSSRSKQQLEERQPRQIVQL